MMDKRGIARGLFVRCGLAALCALATLSAPASAQTQLLTNGSFSSGTSGWIPSGDFWAGTTLSTYRTSPGYAAGGVDSAGLAKNSANGSVYQTVSIPSNATSATLSFWYNITSQETGSSPFDVLNVTVRNASNTTVLATVSVLSNLHKGTIGSYSQVSFDMSPYKGQSVLIHFWATTDVSLSTTFRIDDVSLVYQAAAVNPQLTVSPASGPSGTVFAYSGTGFTPSGGVTKHVRKPDGTEYPVVSLSANSSGQVSDSYNSTGQTVYGTYTVWFVDNASGLSTSQKSQTITAPSSTVNPQLTVSPASGPPGTIFSYAGTGFTLSGGVTKHVRKPDGTEYPVVSLSANSSGQVSDSYNSTGQTVYGIYTIWFVDNASGLSTSQKSQTITAPSSTVSPQLTVSPASGPPGTIFSYSGTAFTPSGGVTKHVRKPDGTEYPVVALSANSSGQVVDSYNSTGQTVYGTYTVWFVDNASSLSSSQNSQTITAPPLPILTSVTPASGPTAGATTVSVAGSNFLSGAVVTFGGIPASNVVVVSATNITCKTPLQAAGAKAVTVTNLDGQASAQAVSYTYNVEVVPADTGVSWTPESSLIQRVDLLGGMAMSTPMSLRPELSTENRSDRLEIWSSTLQKFVKLELNPALFVRSNPTFLVIHGWQPCPLLMDDRPLDNPRTFVQDIGVKLSTRNDINVLAWNWLKYASTFSCIIPSTAAREREVTQILLYSKLVNLLGADYIKPIHIFGHSLGAAIAVDVADMLLKRKIDRPDLPDLFQRIDQLTLADPPEGEPLARVNLTKTLEHIIWENKTTGMRRPIYIDNLRSQFGASYEGVTNVNFEYGLDIKKLVKNHSFGYQWYFGIQNIKLLDGTLGLAGCPRGDRYGAFLSKVLACSSTTIEDFRAEVQDQPGGLVTELAMRNRSDPYKLELKSLFPLSLLAPTERSSQFANFTLQDLKTENGLVFGAWRTYSAGNVILDKGRALGTTLSPVVLTTTISLPTDILYMSFDVARSTGLPNDMLGVYFDSNTLVQFSGEAFAASTEAFTLGPIDLSGYAGRTGALTFVYASTQPGITVTFSSLNFTSGSIQPATPRPQFASSNLNAVRAYPIPWKPGSGGRFDTADAGVCGRGLIFDQLTAEAKIRIYTMVGDLVREIGVSPSDGGCKAWDGKNDAGADVASGIYIAIIKGSGGKAVKKLAIER